jgi:hypothetical protein
MMPGLYLYFISPEATDYEMIPPEANVKVADVTNCSLSRVHYQSTLSNHRHLHLEAAVRPITVIKWLSQAQGQAALGQSWTLSSQDKSPCRWKPEKQPHHDSSCGTLAVAEHVTILL